MRCDSQASLFGHTLTSFCLGHKPKARVATLGYMAKQIYDKHKAIWWERVNAGQNMTLDDFI
jgi:hypothetical protein